MADKINFYQQHPFSPADQLRTQLQSLEDRAVHLPRQNRAGVLAYFGELDSVQQQLTQLITAGGTFTAESVRLADLQTRIARHAGQLLNAIGGAAELRTARPANVSRESHPWWFVDEIAAEKKTRARKRLFTILGVAGAIVLAVVIAFNTVLKPDPAVVAKTRHFEKALELVTEQQNYPAALAEIEQALAAVPDDEDSLVFKAVLLNQMGRTAEAKNLLAKANARADDPAYVPLARGRLLQQLGKPAEALSLAQQVLKTHPDSAEAWFLAGQVYSQQGDTQQAYNAFSKASELALAQGNNSLYVIAKTNLTYLSPLGGGNLGGK